jgi:hypothetical protein
MKKPIEKIESGKPIPTKTSGLGMMLKKGKYNLPSVKIN